MSAAGAESGETRASTPRSAVAPAATRATGRAERAAPRAITARTWTDLAVIAVLTVIGLLGFGPAFRDLGYLLAGAGGLLVGGAVAVLAARYRLGALTTVAVAIVGYFLFGSAFSMPTIALGVVLPTLQTLSGLALGAVFGWADVVTLRPPVSLPFYIDVVAYVAAWLVMLVAATLAARWLITGRRTVARLAPVLVGPTIVYAAGVLLGTDEPYFAAVRGVAFAAISLIWLGWRRPFGGGVAVGGNRMLLRRKLAGTAILVAGAIAIGAGGGGARARVRAPVRAARAGAAAVRATRLSGAARGVPSLHEGPARHRPVPGLRPALGPEAADRHDGHLRRRRLGRRGRRAVHRWVGRVPAHRPRLPRPTPGITKGATALDVSVLGYSDVWVPSTGYTGALTFSGSPAASLEDVRYNAATGTTVLTSSLRKGQRYRLTARDQRLPSDASLQHTPVASIQLPPVSDIPDPVGAKASDITKDAHSPIDKLRAIEKYLKSHGFLSHGTASDQSPSRAGEGADRMEEMISSAHMVGDQEQYASLMALMARSMNDPARVVMGFAPKVPSSGGPVTVTGDDVTAWVEVDFQESDGSRSSRPRPTPTSRSSSSRSRSRCRSRRCVSRRAPRTTTTTS
ncbi:hypothetical protein GCM10025881_08650 [Pseudolysinimonas kribbensis]|uniref:Transglutaminase-like domain-containing protein n=1 Tax=Pseudolysinimonas kribbensis TaxID=433641 RepID=A0ABQ6K5J4_9MICO|nr:transglutaminase-like domain-containing protein [Pseudolysinimonas kribbensis]GMA94041.1 hypothetical protein GCM10025881_08650 [Pseudolysinimonas kribbensis]